MALSPQSAARIRERLTAAEEVSPPSAFTRRPALRDASPEHGAAFAEYEARLRGAKARADSWWNDLIAAETKRVGDRDEAIINVKTRRPAGRAVNPAVVAAIRSGWLACAALNERLPSQAVPPEALVLDWLVQSGADDLAEFVATLPFWPVGLDSDGRWV